MFVLHRPAGSQSNPHKRWISSANQPPVSRRTHPKLFGRAKRVGDCGHNCAAQELIHGRQEFVGRAINLNSELFQRL
jgi:hypothetical protein